MFFSVPLENRANLDLPPMCIWSFGTTGMVERCFLGPDVNKLWFEMQYFILKVSGCDDHVKQLAD